ncbi:MerR family DNA-binding transcriptional regulator [Gordonia terrae]|uniref:MerR family DNA-binding transcriptional regulator n=1 Tax=Gordonia terrae TaxID=2055 RepID=A0AAD0K801_9ACTN|nr:MerR family DNA-binding transcriptional regulator [Gordonia terrae]
MISDMPSSDTEHGELVPIGAFAQRTGLTASALRFYADSAVLTPASIDASTGYRLYSTAQETRAITLRRLREIGMSLADIRTVLDAEPTAARELIDDHVRTVMTDAARTRREAAAITTAIAAEATTLLTSVRGPVLAAAIGQVLTATARDAEHPVLDAVEFRFEDGAVTLTSTDRYRISSRSLPTGEPSDTRSSGTLCAGDPPRWSVRPGPRWRCRNRGRDPRGTVPTHRSGRSVVPLARRPLPLSPPHGRRTATGDHARERRHIRCAAVFGGLRRRASTPGLHVDSTGVERRSVGGGHHPARRHPRAAGRDVVRGLDPLPRGRCVHRRRR